MRASNLTTGIRTWKILASELAGSRIGTLLELLGSGGCWAGYVGQVADCCMVLAPEKYLHLLSWVYVLEVSDMVQGLGRGFARVACYEGHDFVAVLDDLVSRSRPAVLLLNQG